MLNILFAAIIILLNVTYIYFWIVTIYARLHHHIDESVVTNDDIASLAMRRQHTSTPSLFTIQITTRGGSHHVVKRGIEYAITAVEQYPVLKKLLIIEVITEDPEDVRVLELAFPKPTIPVSYIILPKEYQTPNSTKLKARALHYMVERHRENPRNAYIIHYDEESVFTPENLARLIRNLLRKPIGISEGSISYPLEWRDAHPMCRTMESNRPFGCHECYLVMTHPAPLHLHGSNLVIQERIENRIGWDIGQYDGNPLIAEDLVFGLAVYLKYGKKVFGWHGAEMLEQPPFTLKAAHKQRERWILGAMQGVNHVRSLPGWNNLSFIERSKIQWLIRIRVITYALGFPVSIISLSVWVLSAMWLAMNWAMTGHWAIHFAPLAIPGLLMWVGGTQLGLSQNLRYTDLTRWERFVEHFRVMALTPFAGLFDTSGAALAVFKWATGNRSVIWHPTPKLVGQEFGDNVKEPVATIV